MRNGVLSKVVHFTKAKHSLGKYWKDSNHLDEGVWVPDGPAVVGVEDGDVVGQHGDLQDAAQFVLSLLASDPVNAEPGQRIYSDVIKFCFRRFI